MNEINRLLIIQEPPERYVALSIEYPWPHWPMADQKPAMSAKIDSSILEGGEGGAMMLMVQMEKKTKK